MSKSKAVVESAPAAPRAETVKYAGIMDRAIAGGDTPSERILASVVEGKTPRPGTARAAALAALLASIGQPEPAVLAALAAAERQWHRDLNRAPKAVSPAGWLRTFGAKFS